MLKYILKRLLLLVPVVLGVTFFIFVILSFAPGDPAQLILGAEATPEMILEKREELGLNDPLILRYGKYIWGILHGDFGSSWYNGYDVLGEFAGRLPNTLKLGIFAMAISSIIGIALGVVTAVKQYSGLDYMTLVIAMLFSSLPAFWFGLMTQIYFALKLKWLPATGADSWMHFILPAFTLAAAQLAGQVRLTRSSMLDVIKQDYVRTARSKGCTQRRVIMHHVMRNGMLPVVTGLGMSFAGLISGAIVTESVFSIPGVASLMINAVKIRDVPVVMGILFVIAVFIGCVNLLVDLLYGVIDPRVKIGDR
ncbi:MAG: ABC transporter permease [Christensenellales bacterium]